MFLNFFLQSTPAVSDTIANAAANANAAPSTTDSVSYLDFLLKGGIMIIPIITSVSREVFSQTPLDRVQAAYALGATKWGMIRAVVLPFGAGGVVGGSMLGLGRAFGETVAVFSVLNIVFRTNFQILF